MEILATLFFDAADTRAGGAGTTRLDISGAYFSLPVRDPFPAEVHPHLLVLTYTPLDAGPAPIVIETAFTDPSGAEVARSRQVFPPEPGRFSMRFVQGRLVADAPGTWTAEVVLRQGPGGEPITRRVPLTLVADAAGAIPGEAEADS